VDPSPLRVRVCTANARRLGLANARFVVGDGAALPFATASFDLVTAASSIEEASAPEGVLAELARVLRRGGVLRASSQDWRLGVPGWESLLLWEAPGALLITYVRRSQQPPIERRYTLVLPADGEAARLHGEALLGLAAGRRAYGETLLEPALGVPLLERLAPYVVRCTLVELHRWSTPALVDALRAAGFTEARATVHPGELGRRFARDLLAREAMTAFAPLFAEATRALGTLAGSQPGEAMVTAVR
jgi:SAM-dependent methyltransferase